jgi:betaine-aldehyde dehydrogenase
MELGGKSAAVFLEDADLNLAFQSVVPVSMYCSGQGCVALTRLLVPRSRHQEITAAYLDRRQDATNGIPVRSLVKEKSGLD